MLSPSVEPFNESKYKYLMDGLEAVEVKLSKCARIIDFRIDANTYKKDYIRTDNTLKSLSAKSIESLMVSIQNFGAYSLCNHINFCESGTPFLMTQNVRHNYIDWNDLRYIDEKSHKLLRKSHCNAKQVLVTMAGEYLGRVAVYNESFICSSNQAIAKITLKKGYSPYYISTFLNTRYGQNQINRFKTITGQPNINMGLIQSLEVVVPKKEFADKIEQVVLCSDNLRKEAKVAYESTETILLSYLRIDDYTPNPSRISIKSYSNSFGTSGRFDSEYYQPKYEEIEKLINSQETVASICKLYDANFMPDEKIEYKYIELSNIGKSGEISNVETIIGAELPTRARRIVKKGQVIVSSIEGSLESCALIGDEYDNALCSTGFYVVSSDKINPETLLTVFKSKAMQAMMKKRCSGTILTAMTKDEFLSMPIPKVDVNIQLEIATKIQESFALRKKSFELLELAKTAVEVAIEQGENKAMDMLEGVV